MQGRDNRAMLPVWRRSVDIAAAERFGEDVGPDRDGGRTAMYCSYHALAKRRRERVVRLWRARNDGENLRWMTVSSGPTHQPPMAEHVTNASKHEAKLGPVFTHELYQDQETAVKVDSKFENSVYRRFLYTDSSSAFWLVPGCRRPLFDCPACTSPGVLGAAAYGVEIEPVFVHHTIAYYMKSS